MYEKLDRLREELKRAERRKKSADEKLKLAQDRLREAENAQILFDVEALNLTPEQVAQNRRCVEAALDMMWRKTYGLHLTNFDWGEKPEGYGRTRVTHPKI